jgi:hypothetical protein
MAVMKEGSKFVHISKEECLKELIVWIQEFIPPPICFFAEWIVGTCQDDESSSHSLIWPKHLDPTAYRYGKKYHHQRDYEGHMRMSVYKCKFVNPNLINKGTC